MLVQNVTAVDYSIIHTNKPFKHIETTVKITAFQVTHNGLFILHISAIVDVLGHVSNSGFPNSFGLSFPSTNPNLYIILISPHHILW